MVKDKNKEEEEEKEIPGGQRSLLWTYCQQVLDGTIGVVRLPPLSACERERAAAAAVLTAVCQWEAVIG